MNKKDKERNSEEIELYTTKWFDYRHLSPDLATMRFMHSYAKAMETYNDMLGFSKHRYILRTFPSMSLNDLRNNAQFKQLASLRRFADRYGIPYPMYWTYATNAHHKLAFTKTFISTFAHERIKAIILDLWNAKKEHSLETSDDPLFKADSFQAHPSQVEYYDYLIEETIKRNPRTRQPTAFETLIVNKVIDKAYMIMNLNKRRNAGALI